MKYRADSLVLAHLVVAFGAFAVAAVLGAGQMLARSPLHAPFERPDALAALLPEIHAGRPARSWTFLPPGQGRLCGWIRR